MYLSQIGFFHLIICISVSSMSCHGLIAHFFLALDNIPLSGCTTVCFIHSSPKEHLGCFQVLAIMNNADINILVQAFVKT